MALMSILFTGNLLETTNAGIAGAPAQPHVGRGGVRALARTHALPREQGAAGLDGVVQGKTS
jgi:hypothetical protein